MSLFLNELAPYERRKEYYNNIQLGKDVKTQTEAISRSTKTLVAAQMASTSAIISSQERISEGIDNLAYGVEKVEQGIYGLQAAFEWGISEVVWQIEQNREVLQSILGVLSAPLDTQAKELRKRAEEAYANGWNEDALEDFLESEKKNRYDFSIHISIGMIYLFSKINKEKAIEYFDKAIKYARPKSNYHTSFALLHKAVVKRDLGFFDEAEACASEAVDLSPDFAEALYQCAQYNALLNRSDKSMRMLNNAILIDVNYCEKSWNDEVFNKLKPQIDHLFEKLRNEESSKIHHRLETTTATINKFNNLLSESKKYANIQVRDLEILECLAKIKELMRRNSYRDYIEVGSFLEKLASIVHRLRHDAIQQIKGSIESNNSNILAIQNKRIQKRENKDRMIQGSFSTIFALGVIISLILGFQGCWDRGPAAPINSEFSDKPWLAVWALIRITGIGIAISLGVAVVLAGIGKILFSGESGENQIANIQSVIDRLNGYITDFNSLGYITDFNSL